MSLKHCLNPIVLRDVPEDLKHSGAKTQKTIIQVAKENTEGKKKVFPCGKCYNCMATRRRKLSDRLSLERTLYHDNTFLTLTYADESLTLDDNGTPILDWSDISRFLDSFRRQIRYHKKDKGYRFFLVGEYGAKSNRPHYHIILFGIDHLTAQQISEKIWKYGFTKCLPSTDGANDYVCSYVTKKMFNKNDEYAQEQLGDRPPEFKRASRGLGFKKMQQSGELFSKYHPDKINGELPPICIEIPNKKGFGKKLKKIVRLDPYARKKVEKDFKISDVDLEKTRKRNAAQENIKLIEYAHSIGIKKDTWLDRAKIAELYKGMYKKDREIFEGRLRQKNLRNKNRRKI